MSRYLGWAIGIAVATIAVPALADVKAGVELWSKGDWKGAIDQWRQPAIAGDPDAQYNMGFAYKLGRGVPMDDSIAQGWFRKSALQGHSLAQASYAISLFQSGKTADALPWLEKAAARDERRAELMLGTMLFNGDAAPKDWPRAYALVTRASQQGLPQAAQTLAQMDQYVPSDQRAKGIEQAKAIAQQAKFAALENAPVVPSASDSDALARPLNGVKPQAKPAKAVAATKAAKPEQKTASAPAKPAAKPVAAAAAPAAKGGNWRVQLGAFREQGAAQAQWTKLKSRLSGAHPAYEKAGAFTRLQATGFASKDDAAKACTSAKAAGAACLVVAP